MGFTMPFSNGNIKHPIRKSFFAVTLPLKLFRATVANADIGRLNPRLTKPYFVTRLTKGGGVVTTPSLDFPNRTPYEVDFGINRPFSHYGDLAG